jgi:hypothetical protein
MNERIELQLSRSLMRWSNREILTQIDAVEKVPLDPNFIPPDILDKVGF